ncbi:hypothetical protein BDN70DRAFT_997158 [Pholiota conissans]|uniref:C2H2-type domain-containing protein n=1 Tax=Pholiota conissans TaxID=109636 RepID=A0A9P6CP57_9AGAR|nr:hypothetical protein BDN70DRAFT_997158 [Pholiota conissans]
MNSPPSLISLSKWKWSPTASGASPYLSTWPLYQHPFVSSDWCFDCSRDFGSPSNIRTLSRMTSSNAPFVDGCLRASQASHTTSSRTTRTSLMRLPSSSIHPRTSTPPTTLASCITIAIATAASFNRTKYPCFLCRRPFGSLGELNVHLNSAAHDNDEEFRGPPVHERLTRSSQASCCTSRTGPAVLRSPL